MNTITRSRIRLTLLIAAFSALTLTGLPPIGANAAPTIYDHMMPAAVTHVTAKGRTVWADFKNLAKINTEYGDAYRLREATYTFDAPDRLEYRTQVGPTAVALIATDDYRLVQVRTGMLHKDFTLDIKGDITKRQTLFALGVLPNNYLETVNASYQGRQTLQGINCEVFDLRWVNEKPDNPMHWLVWVNPNQHCVVQKKLWDDHNNQRETILYLNPVQVTPNFWMPSRAECYNPEGELSGVIEYANISATLDDLHSNRR